MRYKTLVQFLTTAAIAGALTVLPAAPQSDNSKSDKADQPTADQAKNTTSDRDTMQKIRQSITADNSLSTSAHNVKIIAKNGKVTLKGTVHSDAEKQAVEAKAVEVAGTGNVTNDLTVKPEKANRKMKTEQQDQQQQQPQQQH